LKDVYIYIYIYIYISVYLILLYKEYDDFFLKKSDISCFSKIEERKKEI